MILICPTAGVGSYLQPFIVSKPKALIKIAGKPIIAHTLLKLKHIFPEKTKIIFIVGYKKRLLIEYLEQFNSNLGHYFEFEFLEQEPIGYGEEHPVFSGIGDAIYLAKNHAQNDDCFIFFSDRLPVSNYDKLIENFHNTNCDGIFNVKIVDDPENYGVCVLDDNNKVVKVYEKPEREYSKLATQGAFIVSKKISPQFFEKLGIQYQLPYVKNDSHGYLKIIQKLIDEGAVFRTFHMQDQILDFGSIDKFIEGNRELLVDTQIQPKQWDEIKSKNNIQNTIFIPPVFIGNKVTVTNSIIGPNVSIGNNTVINKSILSDTVVGDCTSLESLNTDSSIIGDYVTIENLVKNRISIGDASSIMSSTEI